MTASIFHTLREGRTVAKHPTLGVLVSDLGEVLTKINGWCYGSTNGKGYKYVTINRISYRIHRLIAETFIINTDHKPTVDHINQKRDDNRVSNLRWFTTIEQANNRYNNVGISRLEYSRRYARRYAKTKMEQGYRYRKCSDGKQHWVFVGLQSENKAA